MGMEMTTLDVVLFCDFSLAVISFVLNFVLQKAKKNRTVWLAATVLFGFLLLVIIFGAYFFGWKSSLPLPTRNIVSEEENVAAGSRSMPENEEEPGEAADEENDSATNDDDAIAAILSEAEQLAKAEDYEGAIEIIKAGIVEYGGSSEFSAKLKEYNTALDNQKKEKQKAEAISAILKEAEELAKVGDYEGAVQRIVSELIKNGDSDVLIAKLTEYIEAAVRTTLGISIVYNGHYYWLYEDSLTWAEAEAYCESLGGHLATITSQEEETIVENLIKSGRKNSYWLGAKKGNVSFSWVTDEPFVYTHWARFQPDNRYNEENALMIYRNINPIDSNGLLGTWNDLKETGTCGQESFFGVQNIGFVCEWDNP